MNGSGRTHQVTPKNPDAMVLGRLGGLANTPAQERAQRLNLKDAKGGRPRLDPRGPSTYITVAVPHRLYRSLFTEARRLGVKVQEVVRRHLAASSRLVQ